MPNIEVITDISYEGFEPYHFEFDNVPLKNIVARQRLINAVVDKTSDDLGNAIGDAGSLSARLDKSLLADGSIKMSAIDAADHSIEAHTDTVNFVRMTAVERAKLDLIDDEANNLQIIFDDAGISSMSTFSTSNVVFVNGVLVFANSDTLTWRYEGSKIYADFNFSTSSLHIHTYNEPAIHVSGRKTYKAPVPFEEGSLRVYINGSRIFPDESVYHPGPTPADTYTLNKFSANYLTGVFTLNIALTADDVVICDFDRTV